MGFDLSFYPIQDLNLPLTDADREGLREFLESRGLTHDPVFKGRLIDVKSGEGLAFDGQWSDLTLDPLDQSEPVTGSLGHATLTEDEFTFVYELCAAGKLMIVNPQGDPTFLGIVGVHTPELFSPELEPTEWALVDSPAALATALGSIIGEFRTFLHGVLETYEEDEGTPQP